MQELAQCEVQGGMCAAPSSATSRPSPVTSRYTTGASSGRGSSPLLLGASPFRQASSRPSRNLGFPVRAAAPCRAMAKIPTVKLSSGYDMPVVGMGVWRAEKGKLAFLVKEAIKIGYRHFDCAGEHLFQGRLVWRFRTAPRFSKLSYGTRCAWIFVFFFAGHEEPFPPG